jgi:hypothetical protein
LYERSAYSIALAVAINLNGGALVIEKPHSAIWLIPAIMLFVALMPLPYGYYTLLRFVVCAAAAYLAYVEYTRRENVNPWVVGLALIAFLFNPIIPVFLSREIWAPINVAAGVALVVHWRKS